MSIRSSHENLQTVFEEAVAHALRHGEVGIQLVIYHGGKQVVDISAGLADRASGTAVTGDTLFNVFSVTKALVACCLHLQVERGLVDYDEPVARYWPEFAACGKDGVLVRHLLQHRSGLYQMPDGVTPEQVADYQWMVDQLAATPTRFVPGTQNGYQSYTFGWLVSEVVRRTDPRARLIGDFAVDEVLRPLGITDFSIGLPATLHDRVAEIIDAPSMDFMPPDALYFASAPKQVAMCKEIFEREDIRACTFPGVGGIANARSVARLFAMLANGGELAGVRLLSPDLVRSFAKPRPDTDESDLVMGFPARVGMGFWLGDATTPYDYCTMMGRNPRAFGHPGAGGSIAWADLEANLAVAICHNRMFNAPDPAYDAIRAAISEVLGVG